VLIAFSSRSFRGHILFAFGRLSCCPICECTQLSPLPPPGHWIGESVFSPFGSARGLSSCRICGFIFTNPRPNQELLNLFYSGDDYGCHEANKSNEALRTAELLLEFVEGSGPQLSQKSLLDFGCGGGFLLEHAARLGWDTVGFDVGARALRTCRQQGLKVTDDLADFQNGSFGAIIMNHVFEHVGDPVGLLFRLRQLLRHDGRLLIRVPNVVSLRARLSPRLLSRKFGFDERYRAFPIHLSYFNKATLCRLLDKADYEIAATRTVGLGLDEMVVGRQQYRKLPVQTNPVAPSRYTARPRWRKVIKAAFFGAGLGEYLQVVAHPKRT